MPTQIDRIYQANVLLRGTPSPSRETLDEGEHAFLAHTPLWDYHQPSCRTPFEDKSISVYDSLPEGTDVETALQKTKLFILLGASASPQLLSLLVRQDVLLMIVDPEEAALETMLQKLPEPLSTRSGILYVTGNPEDHAEPIQEVLPNTIFEVGFPVFFSTERIREEHSAWAKRFTEYLETLFYRHRIYPLDSQQFQRAQPIRNITRGIFYDQQLHAYANIPDYLRWPSISEVKNRFRGDTAILVAAGPELPEKIDYIKANQDSALVICVNNALKPLLEHGIEPHFVIINDTSIESGKVFGLIRQTSRTILVGHCLSELGNNKFRRKFLFGTFVPEVFGQRPMLRLHGSVISTAFSLARHLGCARCVFIGAQLASRNPWGLSYSKGTVHGESKNHEARPLINRHPQLYPVGTPHGDKLYTTLNFFDAALWLSEEIRTSGIECINTSRESILQGKGITHDPAPAIEPDKELPKKLAALNKIRAVPLDKGTVFGFIKKEFDNWHGIRSAISPLLEKTPEELAQVFPSVLDQLDSGGISHLVERFDRFSNAQFMYRLQTDDPATQDNGRRYYLSHVVEMASTFLTTLENSFAAVQKMMG